MSHSLVEAFSHWPVMQRPRFHPRPTHVGYVVDKMVLAHVFLEVTQFFSCQFHSMVALFFIFKSSLMLYNST